MARLTALRREIKEGQNYTIVLPHQRSRPNIKRIIHHHHSFVEDSWREGEHHSSRGETDFSRPCFKRRSKVVVYPRRDCDYKQRGRNERGRPSNS
jgi:hypothetical protein